MSRVVTPPPVPFRHGLDAWASMTAGSGIHRSPVGRVPHGQRHSYLVDYAVRLVRAGITDPYRIVAHLRAEFDAVCEPDPSPRPGDLEAMADWAARTRIAQRERTLR